MTKPKRRSRATSTKKKGRPAFAATDADRRKVKTLRKSGLTEAEIAGALGITEPTLRKHFAAELAFVPTAAQRRKVSIAAGAGMSPREIAIGLQIPVQQLKKHFAHELTAGALARRIEQLEAMHAAGKKGNVSAQRAYLSTTLALVGDDQDAKRKAGKASPGAAAKGKKEQAQEDANTATAGSEWDDLLPPHGAVLQ